MGRYKVKYIYTFLIALFSILLFSCSEPTMEEDARRAADLTSQSNQYSRENNFKEAGRTYKEVQEIMAKYKKMDRFDEFYATYIAYMQDASYSFDEGDVVVP